MLAEFLLERECNSAANSRRLIVATAFRDIITPRLVWSFTAAGPWGLLDRDVLRNALTQSLIWRSGHIY